MKRRIITILVSISLIVTAVPLTAVEVNAETTPSVVDNETILKRIDELGGTLRGTYFTSNRRPAYGGSDDRTEVTRVLKANKKVRRLVYKNKGKTGYRPADFDYLPQHYAHDYGGMRRLGWSCFGFSNFAEWYIFSSKCSDRVTTKLVKASLRYNKTNMKIHAKPGDVLRITGGQFTGHSAIVRSVESDGIVVLDSNTSYKGRDYYTNKVRLHKIKYSNRYTVSISRATNSCHAFPNISVTNSAKTGKPKLSWGAKPGAAKYYVYRSKSKYKGYSLLAKTSKRAYTDTSAKAGTTYYYKVKAVSSRGKSLGKSYLRKRACDCAKPKISSITNVEATGKIKLTWKTVSNANYYNIYRATSSNGTYNKIGRVTATTKAGKKCSYVDSKAIGGKTYYYKIKAGNSKSSDALSVSSSKKYRACDLTRPTVTAVSRASDGKPVLTWNKIAGAEKYVVYRSTSKNGPYTKICTTTKRQCVNTQSVAGKTYYYKVKAIDSNNSSANSASSIAVARTCDLVAPKVTLEILSKDGLPKLSWKSVKSASQYKIYRAESKNGTYKVVDIVKETSFTDTTAAAGEKYYYKVKSIYDKNSDANSEYSNLVSGTCQEASDRR